jgi:PAS domain S-box-containing protein
MTTRASTAVSRLQRALAAAAAGVWEWDAGREEVTLSGELRALLGADPLAGPSDAEIVRTALSRRDRVRLGRALAEAIAGDGAIGLDVEAICGDGERLWLRVAGDVSAATDEEPRASGVAYDVTERKRLELRLAVGEAVSRALVRASSIDEAAPDILESIARATEMEIAGLWLPAEDGTLRCAQTFATEAAQRSHPHFLSETLVTRLTPGQGLVGRAWNARRPIWIDAVAGQRSLVGPRAGFIRGLRSGVAIPLEAGDHLLGVIDLFSQRSRSRDPLLLEALAGLGNEFGLFILRQAAEASVRASDARQRLLVSVMQAQRENDEPHEMLAAGASALGTHLGAAAVEFVEAVGDDVALRSSWSAVGTPRPAGEPAERLADPEFMASLRAGVVTLLGPAQDAAADGAWGAAASGLGVPVVRAGTWQAALVVYSDQPRAWTATEIGLVTDVADHTWDAVERARGRQALRASEARFRGTFENAAVGVAHVAPDGRWLRVNQRLCEITGYREAELLGRTFADITHPDDVEGDVVHLRRMLAGDEETFVREKRYIRPDGTPVWVALTVSLARSAQGQPDYFISVVEDIGGRKAAEARLRTALAVKDEFLGLVSHELRTPMTVILGMSELLAGGRLGAEDARAVAADIADSAADLNDLIESMLLLARLDQDEAQADEPLLVDRVAERALRRQRQRDPSREYTLRAEGDVLVEAHAGLIERIVANLLSNASKYSRPGGAVDVLVEAREGEVLVHVVDEGPGLEDDELERLFEPFFRAPGSSRAPGAGLGLSVVQRIAESFDGRAWAMRSASGGSDFGFALPQLQIPED